MKRMLLALSITLFLSQAVMADPVDLTKATDEVKLLKSSSAIRVSYNYCTIGTLTCRTLVQLMDPATGLTTPDFYNNFISSERAVASTGYFLHNADGTFKNYLDQTFDGMINIDFATQENMALVVTYDADYFPTVHNMYLKRLGTTRYVLADMAFTSDQATIIGWEYDTADTTYKQPVSTIYHRQHGKAFIGQN